jgi:hypothetical protein|tara:strand:- start:235 stop:378 length:144 start_codon:yes stop_codon:yes gene_type:complete
LLINIPVNEGANEERINIFLLIEAGQWGAWWVSVGNSGLFGVRNGGF